METNVAELAVHEKLWAWFETHRNQTLWGTLAVMLAGVGIGFYFWHQRQRQLDADHALSAIVNRAPSTEETLAVAHSLSEMAAQYPNSDAAARALLLAGANLFTHGKYREAKARFDSFLNQYRDTALADQALLGVAACLDASGQTNAAIAAYADIVQHHPNSNVDPVARFALARLYEGQKKFQQAEDLYRGLTQTARAQFDSIALMAGMRLQELLARHPNLAAAEPAITNVPALQMAPP